MSKYLQQDIMGKLLIIILFFINYYTCTVKLLITPADRRTTFLHWTNPMSPIAIPIEIEHLEPPRSGHFSTPNNRRPPRDTIFTNQLSRAETKTASINHMSIVIQCIPNIAIEDGVGGGMTTELIIVFSMGDQHWLTKTLPVNGTCWVKC